MNCCRICLSSQSLTNIFETEEIAANIASIACVNVSQNDGLPEYICMLCKHELDISISFKNKCKSTYALLKKQNSEKIVVKEEIIFNLISGVNILNELPASIKNNVLNAVENSVRDAKVKLEEQGSDECNEDMEEISEEVYFEEVTNNNEDDDMQVGYTSSDVDVQFSENSAEASEQLFRINQDFSCNLCNFNFLNEKSYLSHLQRLHPFTIFQCQVCLAYFPAEEVLNEHIFDKHGESESMTCRVCKESFKMQSQLNAHLCKGSTSTKRSVSKK